MNKPPKKQHYVAQFQLRHFLDPKLVAERQDMLWVYEAGKEPRKSRPQETAFENYFYTFEKDRERIHVVEQVLGQLENIAAPILDKIAEGNFDLSPQERSEFAGYIALSYTRTPFFRHQANSVLEGMMRTLTETAAEVPGYYERILPQIGITENVKEEAEKLRQFVRSGFEVKQTSKAFSIKKSFDLTLSLIPLIEKMDWAFCLAEDKARFLTTDTTISLYDPVVRMPIRPAFASSRRAEFRFPISQTLCLVGNWQDIRGPVRASPFLVRNINKCSMLSSRRFLYASEKSTKIRDLFTKVCKKREPQEENEP